jgi:OmpA-OmpF porin, OOP family
MGKGHPLSIRDVLAAMAAAAAIAACRFVSPSDTDEPLAIQRFVAVPAEIEAGASTMLSWDVEGAESVELDNGIGLVPASGSRTVKPAATTHYLLVAVAGTSLATASIRVVVGPAAPEPSPSPSAEPSPSPSPLPSPSPPPSPSPSPSASPPPG